MVAAYEWPLMKSFRFPSVLRSVVCVGAHSDDIEIGAGGTIAAIAAAQSETRFTFIVLAPNGHRATEAIASAEALLGNRVEVHIGDFEDGFLPYRDPAGVKDYLKAVLPSDTDLVFGPCHVDAHQDHRFVSDLLGETCRTQPIFRYEIIKYDGDLGCPNLYFPLNRGAAESKAAHIQTHFGSQATKPWFTDETFMSVMRLRGIEAGAPHEYAEAFYSSKLVVRLYS
jgi:LmbE family N-acetylglucosaminyl deacetylase